MSFPQQRRYSFGLSAYGDRECPHGKGAEAFHFDWHGEESEVAIWDRCEIRHVLNNRNFLFQKNAVNGTPQVLDIVDVVGVDANERRSGVS